VFPGGVLISVSTECGKWVVYGETVTYCDSSTRFAYGCNQGAVAETSKVSQAAYTIEACVATPVDTVDIIHLLCFTLAGKFTRNLFFHQTFRPHYRGLLQWQ